MVRTADAPQCMTDVVIRAHSKEKQANATVQRKEQLSAAEHSSPQEQALACPPRSFKGANSHRQDPWRCYSTALSAKGLSKGWRLRFPT